MATGRLHRREAAPPTSRRHGALTVELRSASPPNVAGNHAAAARGANATTARRRRPPPPPSLPGLRPAGPPAAAEEDETSMFHFSDKLAGESFGQNYQGQEDLLLGELQFSFIAFMARKLKTLLETTFVWNLENSVASLIDENDEFALVVVETDGS
ncbi:hypothetical protein QYE76_033613 [Lolium multiflorum]|uniref:Uncharacterized protein n=1 Tax=Lolium multiflorum TaxID=4521 RepID=A0AAD8QX00_LOLMU|nr:hypothetical protein QYE76_033613 [Lolium multiflorum]